MREKWKCGKIKPSKNTGGNTNEKENGSSSFDGGNDRITSCRMWGQQEFGRPSGTEPKIKVYYTTLGKDLAEAEAEKEKLAEALKPILA